MTWHPARWLAVLVVAAGVFWPAVLPTEGGGAGEPDPASITDLHVDLTVDRDGTLHGVETVTTDMPADRHGIFRFWDVDDASDPHARLVPHDITVRQDNGPATVDLSWSGRNRYRVAKIGDPGTLLTPGKHVYRIGYTVDGALSGDGHGHTRLYWDVVPGGWAMAIGHVEATLHLPGATGPSRCAVGFGATGGCTVQGTGGRDVSVSVDDLAPRTPVTVQVPVAVPPPDRVTLPWTPRFDPVLSRSPLLVGVVLVLAAAGLVLGGLLGYRSRERTPGLPLQYTPPEGIGPVQAAYVVTERVPRGALAATLFYAAEQGLVGLEQRDGDWTVRGKGAPAQWAATDLVSRGVGQGLGVAKAGKKFTADGTVTSGSRLKVASDLLASDVKGWARTEGLMRASVSETLGKVLVGLAIVLALLGFFLNPWGVTILGLPFAAFALGGFALVEPGAGTRRTAKGRELWSRAGGFARILSTPSAEQRFEFSGREELYTAYIPWAMAFGCAEEWQRKYETEMGRPAPTPAYVVGPYVGGWGSPTEALDSFEHSLSSSISAYQASQRSSSGGGGGFSGGGGGGGGGGGSW
jgi:uncharacterized membrane protein YgcG